tara:strand:+ start:21 stop:503 length:483 start_codon:yes stop_codon:yes gene_type:complete
MYKITLIISALLICSNVFAAGGDGGGSSKTSMYDEGLKLVKRAGKLEKKDKIDKAKKLYSQAFKKFEKALSKDKKNPDIFNYLGYTSRKSGNFTEAEEYYLSGLNINPKHNGINEYLGELYVQTNRIQKASERLQVLKGCNCDEYKELELIIKTKGTKIY